MNKKNYLKTIIILVFGMILLCSSSIKPYQINEIDTSTILLKNKAKREMKNLAIFIRFKDSNASHIDEEQSIKNAETIFNSNELFEMDTINGKIKVPSLKTYYEKQSYGNLSVITEFFPKKENKVTAYQDTYPIEYYLKYNEQNPIGYKTNEEQVRRETILLENAIEFVKEGIENSSLTSEQLDTNKDGKIDNVMLIIEGCPNLPSSISWGDLLWSHKSEKEISKTILGKKIGSYNLLYATDYKESTGLFSMNRGTYGTIIHEFGHTLGYLDLYRYNTTTKSVGFYDVMGNVVGSNPQNFLTYFISDYQQETAWHQPLKEIKKTTKNITITKPNFTNDEEQRAIKVGIDGITEEYFIIEYYEKQNTYNTHTSDESGLILYRVNEKYKYSGNQEGVDYIYIFRPNETALNAGNGDLTKATLNKIRPKFGLDINHQEWSNKAITFSNGANTGIVIEVVAETADSVTININFPEITGNGSKENPYIIRSEQEFFYLMNQSSKNKYYEIVKDLDFEGMTYPKINFEGNLNGNGYHLKNITSKENGLFHYLGNYETKTKVENIILEDLKINSETKDYLGGFANSTDNVSINNVHIISGNITNNETSINSLTSTGGLIGTASNTTTIQNSTVEVSIIGKKNIGGLIGINNNATIENCFANVTIRGEENLGEIFGLQNITENEYHIPKSVFYVSKKTSAVGNYAKYLHNLNVLKEEDLAIGLTEIKLPEEDIKLKTREIINLKDAFYSFKAINVSMENNQIANYQSGKIEGLESGTTKMYIDIKIGSISKRFTIRVIVLSDTFTVSYQTQVQKKGWLDKVSNGLISGTTGSGLRMETLKVNLEKQPYSGNVEYRTHIQKKGWESTWKKNGEASGSIGEGLRLEAVQIRLTGEMAKYYDIYYRIHSQRFGWLDWAKNGEKAGTAGFGFRVEAIQIKLVKKNSSAPGSITRPYVSFDNTSISYQSQVQKKGWLNQVTNGVTSGTVGSYLRMEGLKIKLQNQGFTGNVEYRTHIQKTGWESTWKKNGELSGTQGLALRLEALQLRLTGNMAKEYDIYYRVHAQRFGWLGWAKNGESAGTAGYGYRLEAIQIVLVRKGLPAPGSIENHYYSI